MAARGRGKKKFVETTLGRAPAASEKTVDISHIGRPIATSIFGLKQALTLFQTATEEVRNYITHECDMLYECRMCRTIFRSLANFILHKRNFCKEKCCPTDFSSNDEGSHFVVDESSAAPTEDMSRSASPEIDSNKNKGKKVLSPIIEKLMKQQETVRLAMDEDLEKPPAEIEPAEKCIVLQEIDSSKSAVFQTFCPKEKRDNFLKNEVMEIHGIFECNEAVLGPDGKVSRFDTDKLVAKSNVPKQDLTCTMCQHTFSTTKTLAYHVKYKHNNSFLVYSCPQCRDTFPSAWCVYRHLYKVHEKTSAQVKRMRAQICSNVFRKGQEPPKKADKKPSADVLENDENQWMNNIEKDKDIRMCGGCGRRFERKAALQSHSLMCTKRIAAISKNKPTEVKPTKPITTTTTTTITKKVPSPLVPLKGSAKRKATAFKSRREDKSQESTPAIEIYYISDDDEKESNAGRCSRNSNRGGDDPLKITDDKVDKIQKLFDENSTDTVVIERVSTTEEDKKRSKRKRALSCDFEAPKEFVAADYWGDATDESFATRAAPYMLKEELKCVSCQASFASLYQLLWHMSLHFQWFRFQCTKCQFMSFSRHDCANHAYMDHGVPNALINSNVLPIPKWKTLCMAQNFRIFSEDEVEKQLERPVPISQSSDRQILNNLLSGYFDDKSDDCDSRGSESSSVIITKLEHEVETILIEDEDKMDEDKIDEVDQGRKVQDAEVICLDDDDLEDACSSKDEEKNRNRTPRKRRFLEFLNKRPVRNRTQSVKTLQDDFVYDMDMTKLMKLGDRKAKKGFIK